MILVFGQTGQVAQELKQYPDVKTLPRALADLTKPQECAEIIRHYQPTAVINAAAYTAVDLAETDESTARIVNGDAPKAMAESCSSLNIPFVHISTDYVFDGTGHEPWRPDDNPAPMNAYGRTKYLGEQGVSAAQGIYAIVRTSWVVSSHGNNFIKTMLRLAQTHSELNVVDDQIGSPTAAKEIASACVNIATQLAADPSKSGIYHFSSAPSISWCVLANTIFNSINSATIAHPITSSEYPTPAQRPLNSRMDCSTTLSAFGIQQPDWKITLQQILQELESK